MAMLVRVLLDIYGLVSWTTYRTPQWRQATCQSLTSLWSSGLGWLGQVLG